MTTLESPPDYIRDAFRSYLISGDRRIGLSGVGHTEAIKRLRFYLDTFEEFISRQESEEIASLEATASSLSEEGRSEFWSWYYPVHWDEIFRTNLRSSFVASLVSLIESQLTEVSRDLSIIARTPIQVSDLKGSLLERARLFFDKFGAFRRPSDEVWSKLSHIYDVRNVFIHHAGYLPAYNHEKRTRQFIQGGDMVTETSGSLNLKREFGIYALTVAQEFLDGIAGELSGLCNRVRRFEGVSK